MQKEWLLTSFCIVLAAACVHRKKLGLHFLRNNGIHQSKPKQLKTQINVLFLDVDGVLNTLFQAGGGKVLHPRLLLRLKAVVDASPGCRIVISSTWRKRRDYMEFLRLRLEDVGIDPSVVIGSTSDLPLDARHTGDSPSTPEQIRADEILLYVANHQADIASWVAVDDMQLPFSECHFVRTNPESGLSEQNAKEIVSHCRQP
jgi:hypothetical protein